MKIVQILPAVPGWFVITFTLNGDKPVTGRPAAVLCWALVEYGHEVTQDSGLEPCSELVLPMVADNESPGVALKLVAHQRNARLVSPAQSVSDFDDELQAWGAAEKERRAKGLEAIKAAQAAKPR